jgi:hypothetical protein
MHNHRFVESSLEVKKGQDKIKAFEDKKTKSGNTILRHFCTNCVSQRFHPNCIVVLQSSRSGLTPFTGFAAIPQATGV